MNSENDIAYIGGPVEVEADLPWPGEWSVYGFIEGGGTHSSVDVGETTATVWFPSIPLGTVRRYEIRAISGDIVRCIARGRILA